MRHAQRLSARELDLYGLREVPRAAPGGRMDVGADGELCESAEPLSNGAPVAVGDALAELVDGLRPDWQTRAACRGLGAAGFFPKGAVVPEVTREVCEACGAAWDCLGYGLDSGSVGIWGGFVLTSGGQRGSDAGRMC